MDAKRLEVNELLHAGTLLNKLGIDESNLRHLKWLFVTRVLKAPREWSRDIEIVNSISPDVALLMVRSQHEWEAHVLEYFAKAEESLKELASKVDADGSVEEQAQAEIPPDARYESALKVLRRSANDPFEPPTKREEEAALDVLREMYAKRLSYYDDSPF